MSEELSFVLITPYSLMKSRTGGIIARLLSRTDLELVGTQVLTPTMELIERYMASMQEQVGKRDEVAAKLYCDYMLENLSPLPNGTRERVLMLLFKGENACEKLSAVIGELPYAKNRRSHGCGETIRDTYADLVFNRDGSLSYFEPALFAPPDRNACEERLGFLADFLEGSPNIVTNAVGQEEGSERTLVLIKPDNWRCPSTKPGNIIDMFSKTGLRIVGTKICQMSVKEASAFYEPVRAVLRKELAPVIGHKMFTQLSAEMELHLRPESERLLTESVGLDFADDRFSRLVEFMSGTRPEDCPEEEQDHPGKVKSMILIYEGEDAIRKIREVLGPADPGKAPVGTVRHEFGQDIMTNTAHASDSYENYLRETEIVKIGQNSMAAVIREYLASKS